MMNKDLGTIEKVDLREVWPNEATDFTPWLAQHLSELGKVLGLDLELQSQEAPVGAFSLDLLAQAIGRDHPVIIENQLELTNHDHLGKLLTYAAGYDAGTVIWVTKEFRDEHRQVLNWLNQKAEGKVEFFGVVVELLKIDSSRPAPNFKLVAFPNEWRPTIVDERKEPSQRFEAYRAFFQVLIDELRERYRFTSARKAQPQGWYFFSSGISKIYYGASFAQGGRARVELYIDRDNKDWNKWLFGELERAKESLESHLSESLEWERLDSRRSCRIAAYRSGTIDNQEIWEEIKQWMIDQLLKFKKVFGPKITELARYKEGIIRDPAEVGRFDETLPDLNMTGDEGSETEVHNAIRRDYETPRAGAEGAQEGAC